MVCMWVWVVSGMCGLLVRYMEIVVCVIFVCVVMVFIVMFFVIGVLRGVICSLCLVIVKENCWVLMRFV